MGKTTIEPTHEITKRNTWLIFDHCSNDLSESQSHGSVKSVAHRLKLERHRELCGQTLWVASHHRQLILLSAWPTLDPSRRFSSNITPRGVPAQHDVYKSENARTGTLFVQEKCVNICILHTGQINVIIVLICVYKNTNNEKLYCSIKFIT